MLGWVVLGKTPRSLPGPRGYNSVNYHLIYYGKRGNLWHGECMRSTECLLVNYCGAKDKFCVYYWWHYQQPANKRFGTPKNGPIYTCTCSWISAPPPGNGFHLLLKDPPGSDEPAAPNNGNVLIIFLIYPASSGCSFKSTPSYSIILINWVLANSKWWVCRKVVVKHSINQTN